MAEVRAVMFPYGMAKNPDGTWTLFNRKYKPVGVVSSEWEEWDIARHKVRFKSLQHRTLAKLDCSGKGDGDRIYFYDDGCIPTKSIDSMDSYLKKLRTLMALEIS